MQNLFNELKSFDGRFSRSQYWGYSIGISVFSNVSIRLLDLIQNPILGIVLILAIVIPSAYFSICVQIKRAHDLGKSGHFVWLTLIPIVNLYPGILFGFFKGEGGTNSYGTDPLQSY
ncbi:DUF805 domain-containing protein [Fusibacter sp. JL216-2]|uniref:DUF805 domain-containing protein n=1 Tax=Fusibacter sp. JL216-2 TaxID=3071453 RepID=UPI003D32E3CC